MVWNLNLYNFFSDLLRWILHNKDELLFGLVQGCIVVFCGFEAKIHIKRLCGNSKVHGFIQLFGEELSIELLNFLSGINSSDGIILSDGSWSCSHDTFVLKSTYGVENFSLEIKD